MLAMPNGPMRFFGETPSAKAVSLAGQMFPVFRPTPKVEDPNPLVRPPVFDTLDVESPAVTGLIVVSAAMLAAACVVVLGARRPMRRREESR